MRPVTVLMLFTLWGCGTEPGASTADMSMADVSTADAPTTGDLITPDASRALPPKAPDRFGFGHLASADRVALWDIDVKPDGEGLPPGSGSVREGEQVYQATCVACHGPTGTEGPNDRLVGTEPWDEWPATRTIGNYWPYATTVYDYVHKAMPQNAPGSLSSEETYAVIAYLLHLNEILPADAVLDAARLAAIAMPARDRFVPDDRRGGAEIR
jgi:cytochrome c